MVRRLFGNVHKFFRKKSLNEHVYMCILTVILKTNVLPKSRRQSDRHDGSSQHYFIALKKRIGKVPQQTDDSFNVPSYDKRFFLSIYIYKFLCNIRY